MGFSFVSVVLELEIRNLFHCSGGNAIIVSVCDRLFGEK
jgi:hypothetical protein